MKYFIFNTALILLLFGCTSHKFSVIHVYSPDKKQCITILETETARYIINGNTNSIPEKDFIKLDIKKTLSKDDEFAGCWKNQEYEWSAAIEGAKILEDKLNPKRFKFSNTVTRDDIGIPTYIQYSTNNCYHFGFSMYSLIPKDGAIIER